MYVYLKIIEVKTQEESVKILQLKLKQPNTMSTNPDQIVEMAATNGLLCPVKALKDWKEEATGRGQSCLYVVEWEHLERDRHQ